MLALNREVKKIFMGTTWFGKIFLNLFVSFMITFVPFQQPVESF